MPFRVPATYAVLMWWNSAALQRRASSSAFLVPSTLVCQISSRWLSS